MINFSIIIAAKNEENNLPKLFDSLNKLDYPQNNYEIIFVNDQSTDNTKRLIDEFISRNANCKIYDSFGKKYEGKKGALDIGVRHAKYEYIMITDADCEPQPNWLNAFAVRFNKGFDFVFGIASFKQSKSIVNKIACFENFRSQLLTVTLTKLGLPYSAASRSLGFKKSSFEKIEGYKNTQETLSGDDDLLIREAVKYKMKIGVVENKDALVFSETKSTWKEYLKQKARHTSTSKYYLIKHKIILGTWHLLNILLTLSPLLMFVNLVFFFPFLFKVLVDLIITQKNQTKFSYKFSEFEIIYLQIIYELLLVVNYFASSRFKKRWD